MNAAIKWLVPLIFMLTLVAALAGLWPSEGSTFDLVSFRGEQVRVSGRGLYYWDTVSMVAQMQANDLVTLVLGLPLLAVSFTYALRGSLRGRLALGGALGFILYTYLTMVFGAQYNALFLVYTALASLSLFALIVLIVSLDMAALPAFFDPRLPRRGIAVFLFLAAAFIALAWLGRLAPSVKDLASAFIAGQPPRAIPALENTTSFFIQAMDLGLIVPLCVLAGILLLKGKAWGYLLASLGLVKFAALGISVSLMGINMARVGSADSPALMLMFGTLAALALVSCVVLFRNIRGRD